MKDYIVMREIYLLRTEIGDVPISVWESTKKGMTIYDGKFVDNELPIHVQSLTKEGCIIELKKTYEEYMDSWMKEQLNEMYGTVDKKNPRKFKG
jgi:hypothetical protein